MSKFKVKIIETLEKVVEVDAKDKNEAEDIVNLKYMDEEYVLDSSNYVDTIIETIN